MAIKYQAFDPDSEVIGQSMLSLIQCINQERIGPYLKKHGLTDIQPSQWYPVQRWLDVLTDISASAEGGAMFDFVSVGMKASEITPWPPAVEELPLAQALMAIAEAFVKNIHRGDVGYVDVELVSDTHLKLAFRTPYPDDLMYGSTYEHARHFLPPGTHFTVEYDKNESRRDEGGNVTIIHIQWRE